MNPFFFVIVLLRLSLATAVNFTQVYEWNELDYEWPSYAKRAQALRDGTFKPEEIYPRYMAVYGERIFLSLYNYYTGIPATLVSLPTSSASSAPPKLTPFPSFEMNDNGNCHKIQAAKGLEVDSVGMLWVLDSGSDKCNAKIWTINLSKNDRTKLIHRFSFYGWMHDLAIDETPNGIFAYISRWGEQHIVVFSLGRNQSWILDTPGIAVMSIALSPKEEPRQLYFGRWESTELYSIPVAALRNGTRTAYPKLIGKWTALSSYRMLMDNRGIIYAAFSWENYISSFNSSRPFKEQHFHKVGKQGLDTFRPFTFALDLSGNFRMTEFYYQWTKPRCRLLKAAVGAKPYLFGTDSRTTDVVKYSSPDDSTFPSTTVLHIFDTTPVPDSTSPTTSVPPNSTCGCVKKVQTGKTEESKNSALIGSLAFFLVLSCIINLWLTLRMRKLQNSNEQYCAGAVEMEVPTLPNPVSPEMEYEEIENDLYGVVTAPAPRPRM